MLELVNITDEVKKQLEVREMSSKVIHSLIFRVTYRNGKWKMTTEAR